MNCIELEVEGYTFQGSAGDGGCRVERSIGRDHIAEVLGWLNVRDFTKNLFFFFSRGRLLLQTSSRCRRSRRSSSTGHGGRGALPAGGGVRVDQILERVAEGREWHRIFFSEGRAREAIDSREELLPAGIWIQPRKLLNSCNSKLRYAIRWVLFGYFSLSEHRFIFDLIGVWLGED